MYDTYVLVNALVSSKRDLIASLPDAPSGGMYIQWCSLYMLPRRRRIWGHFDRLLRTIAEVKEDQTRHIDYRFTSELFAYRQVVLQYRGFLRYPRKGMP